VLANQKSLLIPFFPSSGLLPRFDTDYPPATAPAVKEQSVKSGHNKRNALHDMQHCERKREKKRTCAEKPRKNGLKIFVDTCET
jgi:hypothetical protein